ncbi:hypothetical protein [Nonomuraea longispora]|uniref:hypothetical protein n=1 Tax=Nonomuraea longispora TaxID=1848320 RepID=UPI001FE9B28A|nr:hypothetical protein [Nonomuraea longispora]
MTAGAVQYAVATFEPLLGHDGGKQAQEGDVEEHRAGAEPQGHGTGLGTDGYWTARRGRLRLVLVQATVRSFDEATRSGTVFLDDGTVLEFGVPAFDAGPLRLLRTGQRVNLAMSGGAITYITLSTFPVPGA